MLESAHLISVKAKNCHASHHVLAGEQDLRLRTLLPCASVSAFIKPTSPLTFLKQYGPQEIRTLLLPLAVL